MTLQRMPYNSTLQTIEPLPKFIPMARCDEGYRCQVCGDDVESIADSDLYLRFVLGEIPVFRLQKHAERHIRCNPAVAQYIVDQAFSPVECNGDFDKRTLDADFVANEEKRITRAWRRLQVLPGLGLPIDQYPLPPGADAE